MGGPGKEIKISEIWLGELETQAQSYTLETGIQVWNLGKDLASVATLLLLLVKSTATEESTMSGKPEKSNGKT